jgi:hypothetical protein
VSERFARFRLPTRILFTASAIAIGALILVPWFRDYALIITLQPVPSLNWGLFAVASLTSFIVIGTLAWVSLYALRRVAVSVTCDTTGVTFHYPGRRTRRVEWVSEVSKFNIHDWRDSAARRNLPATFALSARLGPVILAILTPQAFEGILRSAELNGLTIARGGVNKWLTGSPLSTVVYRFDPRT